MLALWEESYPAFDRMFDDVMRTAFSGFGTTARFTPAVDIRFNETEIVFVFDVPGVKRDDIEVTLENRVLTVKGARKLEANDTDQLSLGRAYGEFTSSYALPEYADGDRLAAELADGVLTLRVPKLPKAQPRRISVGGGGEKKLGQ